ncbi:hypothetical protein D9M69_220680 [compost metagenome]
MRDLVLANRIEHGGSIHPPQADAGTGVGRQRPGEAPAIAVEQRQRPQEDGVPGHVPVEHVRQRSQIGAAMVVDHALRVACGAGGIVEGDGLPFVGGLAALPVRIAPGQEALVFDIRQPAAPFDGGIDDVDHQRLVVEQRQCGFDYVSVLRVGDQHLCLRVPEHEGDGGRVQAHVQRVQHGATHGHAEMHLQHLRRVGGHHGHRIARPDAGGHQRRREAAAAVQHCPPARAALAVDDGCTLRVDLGRPAQEGDRRQGHEVDRAALQPIRAVFDVFHGLPHWLQPCVSALRRGR